MADSSKIRAKRARMHRAGDHSICNPSRCGEAAKVVAITGGTLDVPSSSDLVDAYRRRLEEVDRVDTVEGQHVLRLAEAFARMSDSASGLASLSRELNAAMERALEGVPGPSSWVDEVAERRARRLGGAS